MTNRRAEQTTKEKDEEREEANDRKRIIRKMKSKEVLEYERIIQKQRMRKSRENASGKEHLIRNLKAKKGMRLLNSEGSLREFSRRKLGRKDAKGWDELFDWEHYECKSQMHSTNLHQMQPDIVQKLNEKMRLKKEKERQLKEKRKNGEWDYNGESGELYWTGTGEPETLDNFSYSAPTDEEVKLFRQAENDMYEEQRKLKKEEEREKQRMKNEERKEAMRNPIDALPEKELCEYEKIREDIIKERNEAMANCKFFEELIETKKEIGLCKKNLKPEKQTKKSKEKGKGKKQLDKLDTKVGKEPEDKSKISENKEKSKIVIKDPENIMKKELRNVKDMSIVRDEWYYFDIE